jgi:hypothetical protein
MVKEKIVRYSTQLVEETRKQCKLEDKLEIAKNLLALGDSPEKTAKATGLPLRTVEDMLKTA